MPHRLAALAHRDPLEAQRAAVDCLMQYDQAPDAKLHHRLSILFLAKGPGYEWNFREFVEAMARGIPLMALPMLFVLAVLRFKFLPVMERCIEEKHARMKLIMLRSRRFTAAHISLFLRMNEILRKLEGPAFLKELVQNYDAVRTFPKCIRLLDLEFTLLAVLIQHRPIRM